MVFVEIKREIKVKGKRTKVKGKQLETSGGEDKKEGRVKRRKRCDVSYSFATFV